MLPLGSTFTSGHIQIENSKLCSQLEGEMVFEGGRKEGFQKSHLLILQTSRLPLSGAESDHHLRRFVGSHHKAINTARCW
jgi:hypothetical protein